MAHRTSRRELALFWRALALAVTCGLPGLAGAERIWAELERPREMQHVREPIGLVEVRGWAGTGLRGSHDVVVVIDRSGSTWDASGVDIDGDQKVGENVVVEDVAGLRRRVVTDPDDTIAQAQLTAARRLIERLDSETTRMGIVTFAGVERVRARIGAERVELLEALDRLPNAPERGGTYLYGAIIAAMRVLKDAPRTPGQRRLRSIILLSDGLPNAPPPRVAAERAAVRAAEHAANAHIPIYSFAFGSEVMARPKVFVDMARVNGGELLLIDQPGDIIDYVPHMSLTRLRRLEIENATTGERARAVRLFPDGTFDGFAPLAPGENLLRVTIYAEGGGQHAIEVPVLFEKLGAEAPGYRRRLELLLEQLRTRTLETRLAEQARLKRERALRRTLEIEVE